jgi:hypothetical protein
MARQPRWTPTQLVLYTTIVPVAAVACALLALSVLRTNGESTASSQPSPAAAATRSASDARREAREQFRECMENMGADFGRATPRFRSRFSPRPDMTKIRVAATVCQALLENGGMPRPPSGRGSTAPPIA